MQRWDSYVLSNRKRRWGPDSLRGRGLRGVWHLGNSRERYSKEGVITGAAGWSRRRERLFREISGTLKEAICVFPVP